MTQDNSAIDPLLNASDVSRILRCSKPLVYKMAARGQLRCIRWLSPTAQGRRPKTVVRFKRSDVNQFIEDNHGYHRN
jgi:hypothetical protein